MIYESMTQNTAEQLLANRSHVTAREHSVECILPPRILMLYSWLSVGKAIINKYTIQPSCSTRSSDLVTLLRPPVQSRLRITNRSFWHTAPQLWNKLLHCLRVPYQSGSSLSSPLSSGSNPEPAGNLSHGMFHSQLKTYLFSKSFPP